MLLSRKPQGLAELVPPLERLSPSPFGRGSGRGRNVEAVLAPLPSPLPKGEGVFQQPARVAALQILLASLLTQFIKQPDEVALAFVIHTEGGEVVFELGGAIEAGHCLAHLA